MFTRAFVVLVMATAAPSLTAAQESDRIEVVLPRDAIPAIDAPEFEPADVADRLMADDELVIGLVGEREQRAYSTWQLDRHEIVNDVFEGRPIAVTW
ncbi:MAG: DUF3179 domain-containing protein [Acidobacteria bacterium]|nr:DUF3179 domain-containing protein [Acidobacteriota bacterium]